MFAIKVAEKQRNYVITFIINILCYGASEVSLKRFYFALFDDGLTLKKKLKLAYISFCIHISDSSNTLEYWLN